MRNLNLKKVLKRNFKTFNLKALKFSVLSCCYFLLIGSVVAQFPDSFAKVELASGMSNATTFKFAPDGRIFILDRYGEILIYENSTGVPVSGGTIPVFHDLEDGLLGIAFDPNFATNNLVYIYYSPIGYVGNRVSQFTMNGNTLDINSEVTLLEWPTNRLAKFHSGGDMDFDSQGNLYIATGDNTTYPNTYTAISITNTSTDNNEIASAEKSSANTNDLRGKILRIKPLGNGTYSIPSGNLFPNGTGGLPEIYVMGARNPYRIFVDKTRNDWLFWGEVGPDAQVADTKGPVGYDEINLTKSAGNYGWPYFSGKTNEAYQVPYNGTPAFYNNPLAPINTSVFNTGATNLPPAEPALMAFGGYYKCLLAGFRYNYDANQTDAQRLPIEFDDAFFFFDFNRSLIFVVNLDNNGNVIQDDSDLFALPRFASTTFPNSTYGLIDMELGPDGKMYVLEYGVPCCSSDAGPTGKLYRVDYTGITTNSPPVVELTADKTNGSLPLTVNFSTNGTIDPNGDAPLTYSWDFNGDGIEDDNTANPTHIFNNAGTVNVQLKVNDGNSINGQTIKNITIYAGNNVAEFTVNSPVDGGFFNWGDDVTIDIEVNDAEDGLVNCNDANLIPGFGHLTHVHPEITTTTCPQSINIVADASHGTEGELDIFGSFSLEYTDAGGLVSRDLILLHPKRKEAEFFDTQSGTSIVSNTDPLEGGQQALRVDNGGYISFSGRNLFNIDAVKYKVATAVSGGSIEMRLGSPSGQLVATTVVPNTGGSSIWESVETSIVDPGGKNDLFFVFKGNGSAIFDLNYVEFLGNGTSIDSTPPLIEDVNATNSSTILVQFSEYLEKMSAEMSTNYGINNGVSVLSAVLQSDGRTVALTVSGLTLGADYYLTVSAVENTSGFAIVTDNYALRLVDEMRINAGGPQVVSSNNTFIADEYRTGGHVYTANIPIEGTTDDDLYQTEIYGPATGDFTYNIPVGTPGEYDIRLHFAELYFGVGSNTGGVGSRIFNVTIEGNTVLSNFDILTEVSPATALIKEYDNVLVNDGFATITFTGVTQRAKISGIEILEKNSFIDPINATVTINSPTQGANVNQPFDVAFSVEDWTILEGDTHMHYYIDDMMVGPHYSYEPITIENLSLGSHTIKIELFNANHSGTGIFDEVTVNVSGAISCNDTPFPDEWTVKQLESSSLPSVSVYTFADFDFDGDGFKDIVTGGWWYKNPGSVQGNWVRSTIGADFDNVVWVYDFDSDGDLDVLGTTDDGLNSKGYEGSDLVWAQNDGTGNFTVFTNIPSGDTTYNEPFLAGIAGGIFTVGGSYQMAINWNGAENTNSPMQMLTPSADPTIGTWSLVDIANATSTGEDLQAGDIDQDNDLDLFQGTNWIRNNGNGNWETISTGISYVTTADRAQLADFDRDGDLDAVVGQLGYGAGSNPLRFEFAWFEAPTDPTQPWIKHVLDPDIKGSLSVFATDIDFDGDKDIVVGEWLGSYRLIAFENDLCNSGTFSKHILNSGISGQEHHDGARVTDIDNDGDLDIVSNGWFQGSNIHNYPRIYENTSIVSTTQLPTVSLESTNTSVTLPTNSATLIGSAEDPDGGAVSLLWTQQSGPSTATLSGNTTSNLSVSNLIEGSYIFRLTATDDENETAYDEVIVTVNAETTSTFELRINTGGTATTNLGKDFVADQSFDTGSTLDRPQTGLPEPYQSFRFSRSQVMGYDIPVSDGEYTVRLHFAELWFGATGGGSGGVGSRVFDVSIEDQLVEDNLDVFAEVGADAMLVRNHNITVTGGELNIDFSSLSEVGGNRHPIINAIEIIGAASTNLTPVVSIESTAASVTLPENSVTLIGSAEDPDGGTVSLQWTQQSGPSTATLSGNTTSSLSVSNLMEGSFIFRLSATDDENETAYDEVIVTVNAELVTEAPTVNLSSTTLSVTLPTNSATLIGSAEDPDGGAVSLLWTQQSGPSTATLSGNTTSNLSVSNLIEGSYIFRLTATDDENETAYNEVIVTVNAETTSTFELRINTGGTATTYLGEDFVADQSFDIGNTIDRPQTGLPEPYQTFRFSRSQVMGYNITVPDGEYTVRLHFAELWFGATGGGSGGVGSRVFDVSIEDQLVEDNLDVFAEVGADAMLVRNHNITVTGGELNIDFSSLSEVGGNRHPIINAIEIIGAASTNLTPVVSIESTATSVTLPENSVTLIGSAEDPDGGTVSLQWTQQSGLSTATLSGNTTSNLSVSNLIEGSYVFRLTATDDENETAYDEVIVTVNPEVISAFTLRINTGGTATTYLGENFVADQSFDTGSTLDRPQTGLPEPYQSFRFSRSQVMGYTIPVPDGDYTVRLHFAELWFGATGGGSGGVGSRVFDVSIEDQLVEDNLDIFAEVGADAMLIRNHNITVTGGELNIDFSSLSEVGGNRHPIINAIEIIGGGINTGALKGVTAIEENEEEVTKQEVLTDDNQVINPSLYPNPADEHTTIRLALSEQVSQIYLYNLTGKLVRSYQATELNRTNNGIKIDLLGITSGVYMVSVVQEDGERYYLKLIIKD